MTDTFEQDKQESIRQLGESAQLHAASKKWVENVSRLKYSYNFTWLGLPIIQFPQDIVAMQEIVWRVQPDLIIETGVARGGSLMLYASLLELIGGAGQVLGIDIDIRQHNRVAIENHPLAHRIALMQGSSIDEQLVANVREFARGRERVMVALDSNHTHEHVARELTLYAPLVTKGSYLVVFDTVIEDMPEDAFPDRPWGKGNNPKTPLSHNPPKPLRFLSKTELNLTLPTAAPARRLSQVR